MHSTVFVLGQLQSFGDAFSFPNESTLFKKRICPFFSLGFGMIFDHFSAVGSCKTILIHFGILLPVPEATPNTQLAGLCGPYSR